LPEETFYRPGLVFYSKNLGYVQIIDRDHQYYRYPDGSMEIQKQAKTADFSAPGAGGSFSRGGEHEEGVPDIIHDVAGGVFSLDDAAERLGWTDEDKEIVARKMLTLVADPRFNDFELAPEPAPPSQPFPNYDKTHHAKIPTLAEDLDVIAEALAYERYTKNRDGVVKALEEKLADQANSESFAAA
jgi:hypothetical protein